MKLGLAGVSKLYVGILVIFLVLSAVVAIVPATILMMNNKPIPGSQPLNASEALGERIFITEGCPYCHTQQVRPLPPDTPLFGRPSSPDDYARLRPLDLWRMVPEITGTERTGPDLADVGTRQSSRTWNYMHLYNPRSVTPASVMQAFPWLFEVVESPGSSAVVVSMPTGFGPSSGTIVVTPAAEHLVDYILSRQQATIPGYPPVTSAPPSTAPSAARGAQIFSSNCASCHQSNGEGVPGAFPPLKGAPAVTAQDPTEQIHIVLFGLSGKAIAGKSYSGTMPSHTSMSDQDIADVINYERTSWGNSAPTVTAQQVHSVRVKGPGAASAG